MTAGIFPGYLEIEQHGTFTQTWTFRNPSTGLPIDLTGCKFNMQGRAQAGDATPVFSFTSEGASPNVTLGGAAGTAVLTLSATVTALLTPGVGVWDMVMTWPDTRKPREAQGAYRITAGVTR